MTTAAGLSVLEQHAGGLEPRRLQGAGTRLPWNSAAVLLGAAVMTAVYLIPHSMGGSELDYSAVEQGVDPADAIRTGKH